MQISCIRCITHEAIIHPTLGVLPCEACQAALAGLRSPSHQIEFTTESIKEQRKEFANDIEQPHRKGDLNKRWVELHGKDAAKKRGFSEREITSAKYVYNDDRYYKEGL